MLTPDQIAMRQGKLCASDVPAALGLNPFVTPLECWGRLTGKLENGFDGNEDTQIGHELEPWIAGRAMNRLGVEIYQNTETLIDKTDDFLAGTPDYLDINGAFGVEIKNVGPRMGWKWGDEGDPNGTPGHVTPQVATYALITGIKTWYVAAYFGGHDLRIYQLIFQNDLLARLRGKLREFWRHVETDIPPEPKPDDLKTIQRMFAPDPGKSVAMSADIKPWVENYPRLQRSVKDAEEARDLAKSQIAMFMADATALTDPATGEVLFTFKPAKDTMGVDYGAAYEVLAEEKFGADFDEKEKFEKQFWKIIRKGGRPLSSKTKSIY